MLNYDNVPVQFRSLELFPLILLLQGLPGVSSNRPTKYTKIFMDDGQLLSWLMQQWEHALLLFSSRQSFFWKLNTKFPLCLSTTAWRRIWDVDIKLHGFLTGSRWRWVCEFHVTACLRPGKRKRYPLVNMVFGPQSFLDAVAKRKFPAGARNRTPAVQSIL
jgi:hypothetical protein